MGEVYQATDDLLQKTVAIKVLHKSVNPGAVVRFQIEARATARLNHANIVKILDFGITDDYEPYMVIEFLEGVNLAVYLQEQKQLKLEAFLQIFFQVCSGLSHAHKRQVLHRDLKPSNLIIWFDGTTYNVKIVDFGIAKLFIDDQSITSPGVVLGSPLYMSPEQCAGKNVDNRSDIYSLGCVMYECLAGRPPFLGQTALETMSEHQSKEPPNLNSNDDIPEWLHFVVLKCLRKSPEDRYQTVDDLRADLQQKYESSGLQNPEVDKAVENSKPPSHTLRNLLALLAVLTILLTAGSAMVLKQQKATAVLDKQHRLTVQEIMNSSPGEDDAVSYFVGEKTGVFVHDNSLRVNGLTDDQLVQCAKYPRPKYIDLINCATLTGSGLRHLVSRSPTALKFRSEIEDKYFKYMAQMPELRNIDFRNLRQADGSGFLALTKLKKLEFVTLDGCRVSNTMLKNISKIDSVKVIRLTSSGGFDAEGLRYLKSHPLTYLNLEQTNMDDEKLGVLAGSSVSEFCIANNPAVTNKSAEVIKTFTNVRSITFGNTGIDKTHRKKLTEHFGLRYNDKMQAAIKLN